MVLFFRVLTKSIYDYLFVLSTILPIRILWLVYIVMQDRGEMQESIAYWVKKLGNASVLVSGNVNLWVLNLDVSLLHMLFGCKR